MADQNLPSNLNPDLVKWLATRQSQLKITTTTTTPGGQTVDWVPVESQTREAIATPPADLNPSGLPDPKLPTAAVALDEPEPGPAGHVPSLRPDITKATSLIQFIHKAGHRGTLRDTPAEPNPAGYFHATSALWTTTYGCSAWLNVGFDETKRLDFFHNHWVWLRALQADFIGRCGLDECGGFIQRNPCEKPRHP